jgi:hypothetical protein
LTTSIKAAADYTADDFAKAQERPILYNYLRDPDAKRTLVKWVALELVKWQGLYNVARPLNDAQVAEVAKMIVSDYSDLTVEDVAVFFATLRKGHIQGNDYPAMIDRIDWQYIRQCLTLYMEAKAARREWVHQRNKASATSPLEAIAGKDKALEYLQQILAKTKPTDTAKELAERRAAVISKARAMPLADLKAWLAKESDLVTKQFVRDVISARYDKASPNPNY